MPFLDFFKSPFSFKHVSLLTFGKKFLFKVICHLTVAFLLPHSTPHTCLLLFNAGNRCAIISSIRGASQHLLSSSIQPRIVQRLPPAPFKPMRADACSLHLHTHTHLTA